MTDLKDLEALLPSVVAAVQDAGRTLLARYSPDARQDDGEALLAAIAANDAAVSSRLRQALLAARPDAGWTEGEEEEGALASGAWWVVDAAEGNVNHIHGRPGWGVTATLVEDGLPLLTAVVLPMRGETYTAIRDAGAFARGKPLSVSRKAELGAAIVATGQARPGEDTETLARMTRSVGAMLGHALLVSMSVPATLELVEVAAGRMDGFWQFSQVRSGLAAGALLVQEAGGIVSDTQGRPWSFASEDFLAAAPGIHAGFVAALLPIADGRAA
jgi:myo-inositol-1(or 4)-monophosphatase